MSKHWDKALDSRMEGSGLLTILLMGLGFGRVILPLRVGIADPYICSALLISSTVMGELSRRLSLTMFLYDSVEGHPMSPCVLLARSAP